MTEPMVHRPVEVAADHFEIVRDDAILEATLDNSVAICLYDAVEEPGALLHLRFLARGAVQLDVTDRTLASDLLLLDRCVTGLGEALSRSPNLQGKIVAHIASHAGAAQAAEAVLALIGEYLRDGGVTVVSSDVDHGAARRLSFRPMMGQVRVA